MPSRKKSKKKSKKKVKKVKSSMTVPYKDMRDPEKIIQSYMCLSKYTDNQLIKISSKYIKKTPTILIGTDIFDKILNQLKKEELIKIINLEFVYIQDIFSEKEIINDIIKKFDINKILKKVSRDDLCEVIENYEKEKNMI